MPFDGTLPETVASKMRKVFGPNGEHWGKGTYSFAGKEGRYCFLGALLEVRIDMGLANYKALPLMKAVFGDTWSADLIPTWNDAPERTWADIDAALTRLEALELASVA